MVPLFGLLFFHLCACMKYFRWRFCSIHMAFDFPFIFIVVLNSVPVPSFFFLAMPCYAIMILEFMFALRAPDYSRSGSLIPNEVFRKNSSFQRRNKRKIEIKERTNEIPFTRKVDFVLCKLKSASRLQLN